MRSSLFISALSTCVFLSLSAGAEDAQPDEAEAKKGPRVVEDGSVVDLEYTLTLDDGSVVDTNTVGGEPMIYTQGAGQILPALEKAVAGMRKKQRAKVTLSPEEGYGPRNPGARNEVPIEMIPEDARKLGFRLVSTDPQGVRRAARVSEVKEKTIVLDYNHPLAGQTLHFEIKVLDIDPKGVGTEAIVDEGKAEMPDLSRTFRSFDTVVPAVE
jgi:FKBP-type peptidyl-prolyl cis-trans isomerase SlyD